MFCTKCGGTINSGAAFCSHCGNPVAVSQTASIPVSAPKNPVSQTAAPGNYAGFWMRFLAFLIDATLIGICTFIVQSFLQGFFNMNNSYSDYPSMGYYGSFFDNNWLSIIVWWLYFTLMESSSRQGTLGKHMVGLVVTDMNGNRITFAKANARFWSKFISSFTLGIGFIMAGLTDKKQALHDIIASTLVLHRSSAYQSSSVPATPAEQTASLADPSGFRRAAPAPEAAIAQVSQASSLPKQFDMTKAMVWVSRAGMLAVLAGIGYFYKLSIDNGWIAPAMRIVLGLVVAGILLVLGDFWKKRIPLYGSLMTGGGIPLLYFTVFAAFGWYNLIPQALGFVCLILVTLLASFLSRRYHSIAIALMALIGAYVTPGLVNIGQPLVMYVYFILLQIYVLYSVFGNLAYYLLYLSAAGSGLYYLHLWDTASLGEPNRTFSLIFLGLSALLFIVGSAYIFKKQSDSNNQNPNVDHGLGVFYIFASLYYAFCVSGLLGMENLTNQICIMYAVGAAVWIAGYIIISRTGKKDFSYILLYGGMLFSILAILYKSNNSLIDLFIGFFGMLAVYSGFKLKLKELRIYGIVLLGVNFFRVLYYDAYPVVFILNLKFLSLLVESIGLGFVGWLFTRPEAEADELKVSAAVQVSGALLLWFGFSRELYMHYSSSDSMNIRNVLMSLWWAAEAVLIVSLGAIKGFHSYRKLSMVLFGLAIAKVFLYDAFNLETVYKTVSFIIFGFILLGVSFVYLRNKEKVTEFFGEKHPVVPLAPGKTT